MRMGSGGNWRPRVVVVVGGGFAGLSAVRELSGADVDVLLLDRDLYNTFQPLLYQVATGGLNPGDVTYALRAFAARHGNARFRRVGVSGWTPPGAAFAPTPVRRSSTTTSCCAVGSPPTTSAFPGPGSMPRRSTPLPRLRSASVAPDGAVRVAGR
jgi:choline dehydrogenase-like flavoprotein